MGGDVVTIGFAPLPGRTVDGALLLAEVWTELRHHIYYGNPLSGDVFDHYLDDEASDGLGGGWMVLDGELVISLGDAAGLCAIAARAAAHWTQLALVASFDRVDGVARLHGAALTPPAADLDALLGEMLSGSSRFAPLIAAAGTACRVTGDGTVERDGAGGPEAVPQLDRRRQAQVADAVATRRCQCQLCLELRRQRAELRW